MSLSTTKRLPRIRVLGATRSGRLPRALGGRQGACRGYRPNGLAPCEARPGAGDMRVFVAGACRGRFCQGTGPVSRKVAGGMWVRKTNVSQRFNPQVRVLGAQPYPSMWFVLARRQELVG
ncbi:hypothetical protein TIFTF001_045369 [Ficus carica]|uniref:Uncharacterized protein n=1 Tax=Ficus carica TaxID=3494 RepID=A0AA88CHU5_FICCA|nr:hypothetical protein TIFTF001_045369 [Ficus carica]